MPHHRHTIRPVERECVCLLREPDGRHIAQCDAIFRAKFFSAWGAERFLFYGVADEHGRSGPAPNRQAA